MTRAIARTDLSRIAGSVSNARDVGARLREAAESAHLISPATACDLLPEGCSVAFSIVLVDKRDTYKIPGQSTLGLSKQALDRIAAAAGISWDPHLSARRDDGRDPRYCAYRAVGYVREFDGRIRTLTGEVAIDLRPGSPEAAAMSQDQIKQTGRFLLRHAESKAKNRVIRSLGLRNGYTEDELNIPFIVVKAMFTGETNDPVLRREFGRLTAVAFLGGTASLYGQQAAGAGQTLPAPAGGEVEALPAPSGHGGFVEHELPAYSEPPQREPERYREPEQRGQSQQSDVPTVAFGDKKGTPITELSDRDLDWYTGHVEKSVSDPSKTRYRANNQRVLDACRAEQARRAGGSSQGAEYDRGDDPEAY